MIRCIPVDGSEPFEVPDDATFTLGYRTKERTQWAAKDIAGCVTRSSLVWTTVNGLEVSIESWRERAERLEKERDELASNILALIERYRATRLP